MLQFKQLAQISGAKVVLSVSTTSAVAPWGITMRLSAIAHMGLCFTTEREKKTSDLDPSYVAKLTLPNQIQLGYPACTFTWNVKHSLFFFPAEIKKQQYNKFQSFPTCLTAISLEHRTSWIPTCGILGKGRVLTRCLREVPDPLFWPAGLKLTSTNGHSVIWT